MLSAGDSGAKACEAFVIWHEMLWRAPQHPSGSKRLYGTSSVLLLCTEELQSRTMLTSGSCLYWAVLLLSLVHSSTAANTSGLLQACRKLFWCGYAGLTRDLERGGGEGSKIGGSMCGLQRGQSPNVAANYQQTSVSVTND